MVAMKITLSTAMRARDVSRPRDEHLAEAAEREAALTHQAAPPSPAQPSPRPAPASQAPADAGSITQARRRRRRGR